ncbi:MAG: tRNA pseudouridine(55) synthase TruB, partial [Alphaproteobacteria bacterium]|nr:tRNA pseudouridine(55) synthase TruB [Alphaproteobacteria bacterium]
MNKTVQNSEKIAGKNQKSGWVILDKPIGMSSHTATNMVRKICQADKAGHCGTLDPLASGVLPIALGAATKLVDFVVATEKSYEFSIIWGEERSTDDRAGEVTAESSHRPDHTAILEAIPQFIGTIAQIPPDFSAIKIHGKPAYHRARKGETHLHQPRPVTIHALTLNHHSPSESYFTLNCGKGVYVRAIARDLARKLGSFGHVGMLRRTKVGKCLIENAISLEKLTAIGHSGDDLSVLQ